MTIFGYSKGQLIAAGAAGFAAGVVVTEVVERVVIGPVALTAGGRDRQREKLAKLAEGDAKSAADKAKDKAEADAKKAAAAVKA